MRWIAAAPLALSLLALPAQAQVTLASPAKKTKRALPTITGKRTPRAKAKREPGQVMISIRNGDLQRDVLPEFERQAGVKVRWVGAPKKCSLRLVEPVDWETALELVCQFTGTHVASSKGGRIVLESRWGGKVREDVVFDDLDGQVRTPRRLRASALLASAPRKPMPVVRHRNTIPTVKLGGGTLRMGMRGRIPNPYAAKPYVSKPYVSRPYVGKPYVSRNRPARPYVSRNRPARPYVSRNKRAPRPYVSRNNRRARPYVNPRGNKPLRRRQPSQRARRPQPSF